MWKLDHKEALKNWCFQIAVIEKTLESPWDCKEIKPVHPKGSPPWIFIERTDAKTEAPILWPPDVKSQLIGKDPDAGQDWGQEKKGTTEDEMVGWHHWFNGHGFEQAPGDSEGHGSPARCSPWGRKESDTTEWLSNNNLHFTAALTLLSLSSFWNFLCLGSGDTTTTWVSSSLNIPFGTPLPLRTL